MSLSELLPTILRNYFNVGDRWAKSQVIIEYGVDIKKDWKTTLRGQEKLVDFFFFLKKKAPELDSWRKAEVELGPKETGFSYPGKASQAKWRKEQEYKTSAPFLGPELLAEANAPCSELRVQSGDGEASQVAVEQNNANRTTFRGTGWAAEKGWVREKLAVRHIDTESLCKAHT